MSVWFFMLISIVVIRFLVPDALGEKMKNRIFLTLCFIIIVFVVGSRSPQMTQSIDLYNYYSWYSRAIVMPLEELIDGAPMEPLYLVFNKILAWIVPWNYFIIYFEAAFTTGVMLWYINRNADSVYLATIVYVCLGPWQFFLTGFRQSFAICICFIAYELLKKRKTSWDIVSVLLILLATAIHTTAWVFLGVFIIRRLKLTKKLALYAVVLALVLLLSLDTLLSFANNVLGRNYTDTYQGSALGGLVPIIIYSGTLFIAYFLYKEDKTLIDDNMRIEIVMLLTGLCIYCLRYNITLMERVSFYFTPTITIALANSITRQPDKRQRTILFALCVALCIVLFVYRSFTHYGDYHFFWEYLERRVFL